MMLRLYVIIVLFSQDLFPALHKIQHCHRNSHHPLLLDQVRGAHNFNQFRLLLVQWMFYSFVISAPVQKFTRHLLCS
jgi:hypothetical protein